jgi:hypothetical protein
MTEETLPKEAQYLTRALPMYLAAQAATLLFTALDTPTYVELHQARHFLAVSGWLGLWFALVLFGLASAAFLLVRRSWRVLFDANARAKLALGYFLGAITGLLTLGIRFIPVISPQYFLQVGVFGVLFIGAFLVWSRRAQKAEDLFP